MLYSLNRNLNSLLAQRCKIFITYRDLFHSSVFGVFYGYNGNFYKNVVSLWVRPCCKMSNENEL